MSLGKFLISKRFLINIIILIVVIVGGFFVVSSALSRYTHHGENIPVPDLSGMKLSKLESVLAQHQFKYKIVDSLYDGDQPPGTIIDQDPAPKSKVKEGRTIYLTINAIQPPDVKMPDLIDVSFRQAEAMLQAFGLSTGEIIYRSDLAKNAVLEQRFKDRKIKAGTMIPKGSVIDLVLGDGMGDESEISVPDLTGMTRAQAQTVLLKAGLSMGIIKYNTKDSTHATVYKQSPSPDDFEFLKKGDNVDIYLE